MREGLEIFADAYDTPDGTCIRDYIHVSELAEAPLLAVRYLEDGRTSTVLNLGNERGVSVREVVDAMRRVPGQEFPVRIRPRRAGGPDRRGRPRHGNYWAGAHNGPISRPRSPTPGAGTGNN